MYALLAIDSTLRIAFAMVVLFVVVPRLARPRVRQAPSPVPPPPGQAGAPVLHSFWFDLAWGIVILTIAGQLLTLVNLYALPTLLLLCAFVILIARSVREHRSPLALLRDAHRWVTVSTINVLERRVSVARRVRRMWRRARARVRIDRITAGWIALIAIAAFFRLYRPFATANLGYSDSYVHLYLVKLLDNGQQVDPAWGPYPRGMHFVLLAIQRLTNIDEILLVNFFGAFVGILLVLAVADTARRLSNSHLGGLIAGFLFATMTGGARQYFLIGGSFESGDRTWLDTMMSAAYAKVPQDLEFDVLLTAFQRQSSTLSQELAIVLLFPAGMYLLDWLRGCEVAGLRGGETPKPRNPETSKLGFIGCTAAIAATHSGVLVPLVLICAVIAVFAATNLRAVVRGALAGLVGILIGSTWLLGFIAYPFVGSKTHPGSTALFYFPFLRGEGTAVQEAVAYNSITPVLIVLAIVALLLIRRYPIASGVFLVFFIIHISSRIHLPQIVESRRNAEWLLMAMAILVGVALADLQPSPPPRGGDVGPSPRWAGRALLIGVLLLWLTTITPPMALRDRLLNYSGYGAASLAVVEIAHEYEPFSWTLVSYGQEYPMVLGRGFHIAASEFLDRYDPARPDLGIPTRYVFVLTERVPHRFEVHDWRSRFSRGDIERRLETWCQLYRATHDDIRVFRDDGNVQVFQIIRTQSEANRIAREARMQ